MSTHPPNDIEIYHASNLATLVPRTDRGRDWLERNLKPKGWQSGHYHSYHTDASELPALIDWMTREELRFEDINGAPSGS